MSLEFTGPAELRTRGTVLVVPGRGETPETYTRLGRRLAADSYQVRVLSAPSDVDDLRQAVEAVVEPDAVRPVVLIGADLGAALVAALAADADLSVDGVVLAGLPGYADHQLDGWDDELNARTHCPVHRSVLSEGVLREGAAERGALAEPVPTGVLDSAYHGSSELPTLVLAGDADPFTDLPSLRGLAKVRPAARLAVVRGGHHDVLNDLQHRSVAAEIVRFLEELRAGGPIVVPDTL
ncbi:alpha/beta hydrolase [Hamadaea tsunoensis]|uniref:alpha/beta hydrolase n=1 Tax=Hamadaea tsunoensis TaxID=53368 RepID=UPI0004049E0D|nr:alpha/beta fold hydrolase [Hamadaea tsunoensis]